MVLDKLSKIRGIDTYLEARKEIIKIDNPLLQLQHKLYSHLVPAYRTVHRTKPRRIVFRAIRWVNPKRQFKLMSVNPSSYKSMSPEVLQQHIVGLNKYREEALTISNRYDQMLALIELGKTPYRIMWPQDKAMTLDEYRERAERLKAGTVDWERQIDDQAAKLTAELTRRHISLGEIEELWEDDMQPFFKTKGSNYSKPLRQYKYAEGDDKSRQGGKKMKPATPRDTFRTVSPLEVAPGEDVKYGFEVNPGQYPVVGYGITGHTAFIPREDVNPDKTVIRGPIFAQDAEKKPGNVWSSAYGDFEPVQSWRDNQLDEYAERVQDPLNYADIEYLKEVRVHPFQPDEGDYERRRRDPVADTIEDIEGIQAEDAATRQDEAQQAREQEAARPRAKRGRKRRDVSAGIARDPYLAVKRKRLINGKRIKNHVFGGLDLNEYNEDELRKIGEQILPNEQVEAWRSYSPQNRRLFLDNLQNGLGKRAKTEKLSQTDILQEHQDAFDDWRSDPEYSHLDNEELLTEINDALESSPDIMRQIMDAWEQKGSDVGVEHLAADTEAEESEDAATAPERKSLKATLDGQVDNKYSTLRASRAKTGRDNRVSRKSSSDTTEEVKTAIALADQEAQNFDLSLNEQKAWNSTVAATRHFDYDALNFREWMETYEDQMDGIGYLNSTAGEFVEDYFRENVRRAAYGENGLENPEEWVALKRSDMVQNLGKDSSAQVQTQGALKNISAMPNSADKENFFREWHAVLAMPNDAPSKLQDMIALENSTRAEGTPEPEASIRPMSDSQFEEETGVSPEFKPEQPTSGQTPRGQTETAGTSDQPTQPKGSDMTTGVARSEKAVANRMMKKARFKNGLEVSMYDSDEYSMQGEVRSSKIANIFGLAGMNYKEGLRQKGGATSIVSAKPHEDGGSLVTRSPEEINSMFTGDDKGSTRNAFFHLAASSWAVSRDADIGAADVSMGDNLPYMPNSKGFKDGTGNQLFSSDSAIPNLGLDLKPEQYKAEIKAFVDATAPKIIDSLERMLTEGKIDITSAVTNIDDLRNGMFDRASKMLESNTDNSSVAYFYPTDEEMAQEQQAPTEETPQQETEEQAPTPSAPEQQEPAETQPVVEEGATPTPSAASEPSDDDIEDEEEVEPDTLNEETDWDEVLRREGLGNLGNGDGQSDNIGGQRANIVQLLENYSPGEYDSFEEYAEDEGVDIDEDLAAYLNNYSRGQDIDEFLDDYEDNPENRFRR